MVRRAVAVLALGVAMGAGSALAPGATVLVVIVLVLGAWVLTRPVVGLVLLCVILPANGIVTQLLGGGASATAFGALKDILLVILLVAGLARGGHKRVPVALMLGVLGFQLIALTEMLATANTTQALYGYRNNYMPALLLICVPMVLDRLALKRVTSTMAWAGQVAALMSIATWLFGIEWLYRLGILPPDNPADFPVQYFSAGSIRPRAFSPYVAPNEMAAAAAVVVAVILCREVWTRRKRVMLCLLPSVAIILSESRSGFLGLLLVFLVVAVKYLHSRHPITAAWLAVSSALGAFLFLIWYSETAAGGNADPSIGGHGRSILYGLSQIPLHPFGAGVGSAGPRAFLFTNNPILVESFVLLIAIEASAVVAIIFIWLQWHSATLARKQGSWGAYTAVTAVAAVFVSEQVLPTMQEGAVSYTFWIAMGLGVGVAMGAGAQSDADPEGEAAIGVESVGPVRAEVRQSDRRGGGVLEIERLPDQRSAPRT